MPQVVGGPGTYRKSGNDSDRGCRSGIEIEIIPGGDCTPVPESVGAPVRTGCASGFWLRAPSRFRPPSTFFQTGLFQLPPHRTLGFAALRSSQVLAVPNHPTGSSPPASIRPMVPMVPMVPRGGGTHSVGTIPSAKIERKTLRTPPSRFPRASLY